jgi:hypothetical protein
MMTEMLARLERVFVWRVQREREREARANTGEATHRVQEARQRTSRRPALSLTEVSASASVRAEDLHIGAHDWIWR